MSIPSGCYSCRRAARSGSGCSRIAWRPAICSSAPPAYGDDRPLQGAETLAKFGACAEVLERIIEAIKTREPENLPFIEPFLLDDPTWVSNRLSEILPIPMRSRQKLMELLDAGARIDVVHHYMQHHQLL